MPWSQSGNIKGASGQPGASGASGLQGASGVPGATGPTGASGPAGTTTWSGITDKPSVIAAGVDAAAARNVISAENTALKGVANGYAALDASGLVPSSQLPSFVDDVVEAANLAAFPATGESGKIYTALDTNKVYRWGGSSYTEISPSPGSTDAVPEGSTNLYYTAARADGRITAAVGSTVQAYSATLTTYAGKTAPTGAVVGTTDTQTLTNKDLSGSSNTFPAFLRRSVQTITEPTTLGASGSTDYVTFIGSSSTDATFSSVSLLLLGNGSNNSTNIVDSGPSVRTVTVGGGAKISTAQSKFGGSSMLFASDGTDFLSVPNDTVFNLAGDFTIEAWVFLSGNRNDNYILTKGTGGTQRSWGLMVGPTNIRFYYSTDGSSTSTIDRAATLPTSTWMHIAVSRSGSTVRIFKDGTQQGADATYSGTPFISSSAVWVGRFMDYTNISASLNGYLDDVRITSAARYTSNFTAPTAQLPGVTLGTPTLPSATNNTGRYSFRNTTNAAVIIGASGSQTINGATGGLSVAGGASTELVSDGSGWYSF